MDRRIALVTGASRGIGRAIALQLAQDGLLVIISYHSNDAAAEQMYQQIVSHGGQATIEKFDVAVPAQVARAVKNLTRKLGTIDVLINNAAIGHDKPLVRVKQNEWDQTIATNVSGVHHCTLAVVKS